MTLTSLKREVNRLDAKDRVKLAEYLAAKEDAETRMVRIERRMKAMDAGRGVTVEKLEAIHQALCNAGL
jgi:hypothetical protein